MTTFTEERPIVMHGVVWGTIIAAVFVALITILAELVPPIKNWLAETHGHHWVGKGIWTLVVFVISSFLSYLSLKLKHQPATARLVYSAGIIALSASLAILLFFVYEYSIAH